MVKTKWNKGKRTCGEIIVKVRTCVRRMSVCGKKEFEVRKIDRNERISDRLSESKQSMIDQSSSAKRLIDCGAGCEFWTTNHVSTGPTVVLGCWGLSKTVNTVLLWWAFISVEVADIREFGLNKHDVLFSFHPTKSSKPEPSLFHTTLWSCLHHSHHTVETWQHWEVAQPFNV